MLLTSYSFVLSSSLCLDIHTLLSKPLIGCILILVSNNLALSGDGTSESFMGSMQELHGVKMLESDFILPVPELSRAFHNPVVTTVSFSIVSKSTHFLVVGDGRLEEMTVEVAFGGHVLKTNDVITFHLLPSFALAVVEASHSPITVVVVLLC